MSVTRAFPFLEPRKVAALIPLLKSRLASQVLPSSSAVLAQASVAAVFRWREKEQQTLELLFVRRSINKWDTWSGQVAFPGGRQQKKKATTSITEEKMTWETSLETAQRETLEEVGLDLTLPHVHWIGSLPPIQTHLRSFFVSTQVFFIDKAADEHDYTPTIQASEIADVFWVDIQELFNPGRYQPLTWELEDMIPSLRSRPHLKKVMEKVLGKLSFGSIYLPRPTHPTPDIDMTPRHPHDFILWGLTLRIIADLFSVTGSPLPMSDREVGPQFESKMLGDLVLLLYRQPDKALARASAIAAVCAAIGLYSHL